MALFVIGDPHLSFGTDKPMDVFRGWQDYTARLERNWRETVAEGDTVVLPGDISWAMSLPEAEADFAFLQSLPGRKILLKGNHDYWWTTRRKMDAFLADRGFSTLRILHNDAVEAEGVALCGTRGWFFDAESEGSDLVLLREVGRLTVSVKAALATGLEPVAFLHYPPVTRDGVCRELFGVLREYGVRRCYYGHLHGPAIARAINGEYEGVRLQLVSSDSLHFKPLKIL